jgi:hypothetical protein
MSKLTDAYESALSGLDRAKSFAQKRLDDLSAPVGLDNVSRKGAGSFNTGQYQVNSHTYPTDLLSSVGSYGGNYVIFYINVAVDSKLQGKSYSESDFIEDVPRRDRGALVALNLNSTQLAATVAGAGALQGALGGGLLKGGNIAEVAKGAAVGGAAGTVVGTVVANEAATASRAQRRLKTAIAMHVPNQLSIRYGVNWGDEDTGNFQMVAQAPEMAKALMAGDMKGLGDKASAIATNLAIANAPGQIGNSMSAATGLAANPKKEQLFKSVDFRTFSFDYQFFPRSQEEAANVLKIIREFKFHMHPEFKDAGNFLYIYPSEFDISYYQNGSENLNLHKHTSCVLCELNVNYTPNGSFTTFPNGMPTQINVTLGFKELALLTKDKVDDGL